MLAEGMTNETAYYSVIYLIILFAFLCPTRLPLALG